MKAKEFKETYIDPIKAQIESLKKEKKIIQRFIERADTKLFFKDKELIKSFHEDIQKIDYNYRMLDMKYNAFCKSFLGRVTSELINEPPLPPPPPKKRVIDEDVKIGDMLTLHPIPAKQEPAETNKKRLYKFISKRIRKTPGGLYCSNDCVYYNKNDMPDRHLKYSCTLFNVFLMKNNLGKIDCADICMEIFDEEE